MRATFRIARGDGTAFAAEMAGAAMGDTPDLLPLESQGVDKSRRAGQIGKVGAEGGIGFEGVSASSGEPPKRQVVCPHCGAVMEVPAPEVSDHE